MKKRINFFVLAHNIRSLHNVGSIFRTSDVFAVSRLFLTGYTGHPPDPKLEKVALGADKTVPWEYQKSASRVITRLRKEHPHIRVVGLENNLPKGLRVKPIEKFSPRGPVLLVLGEEVDGIGKNILKLCDEFVEIPQFGTKESLNVSVAYGIAAFVISGKSSKYHNLLRGVDGGESK
jgi:tRNA G18 (ribose-2'-O)-methylase SpoU